MSEKGDAIRIQIIDAANRLFYQRGFQATSFADLARESGVPKGNYYFHFKSKEALLEAVIDARIERLRNQLDQWTQTINDPKGRLRRAVRMIEEEQGALLMHGCPIGTLVAELVKSHPEQKRQVATMLHLIEDWMTTQVSALTQNHEAAQRQARSMLARMQGAATLVAAYEKTDVIPETISDLDRVIDEL
ncbi:MAG TPA: TetR family transcriptional regulator [Magnetovibrio sp.]